jgi:hypothetical protein
MVRVCTIALHRRKPVTDSGNSLIPVLLNHPAGHDPDLAPHLLSVPRCAYWQVNDCLGMVNGLRGKEGTMALTVRDENP